MMRRMRTLLPLIIGSLMISGCGVSSNYLEIEDLMLVQSLGFDRSESEICISIASEADPKGGSPKAVSGRGRSASAALLNATEQSMEKEIYLAHVGQLLIGQQAAEEGMKPFLDYVCRDADIRMDIPLYLVKGDGADEFMLSCGDGNTGIGHILQGVKESFESHGSAKVFSLAELCLSLQRSGSGLLCAVELSESSESTEGEKAKTAAPAGFAIIREGRLCGFIDMEERAGLGLLLGNMPQIPLELKDSRGRDLVLELSSGSCRLSPLWSAEGTLVGIDVQAQVKASLLECHAQGQQELDYAVAQLEKEISRQLSVLLRQSMDLKADYLGIAGKLERADPKGYSSIEDSFMELLPALELELSVSGKLSHGNDVRDDGAGK